jgi:hypothetical protein
MGGIIALFIEDVCGVVMPSIRMKKGVVPLEVEYDVNFMGSVESPVPTHNTLNVSLL